MPCQQDIWRGAGNLGALLLWLPGPGKSMSMTSQFKAIRVLQFHDQCSVSQPDHAPLEN